MDTAGPTVERGWNVVDPVRRRALAWCSNLDDSTVPPEGPWHLPPWSDADSGLALHPVPRPPSSPPPPQPAAAENSDEESEEVSVPSPITDPDDVGAEAPLTASKSKGKGKGSTMPPVLKASRPGPSVRRSIGVADPKARPSKAKGLGVPIPPPPPLQRPSTAVSSSASSSGLAPPPPPKPAAAGSASEAKAKAKGGEIRRAGWLPKAQKLCEAVLDERWDEARELARKYYCGPPR